MYTVEYFLEKFSSIPKKNWTQSKLRQDDKACALGHCGTTITINGKFIPSKISKNRHIYVFTEESQALVDLFYKASKENIIKVENHIPFMHCAITSVNDNAYYSNSGDARSNILKALNAIKIAKDIGDFIDPNDPQQDIVVPVEITVDASQKTVEIL